MLILEIVFPVLTLSENLFSRLSPTTQMGLLHWYINPEADRNSRYLTASRVYLESKEALEQ